MDIRGCLRRRSRRAGRFVARLLVGFTTAFCRRFVLGEVLQHEFLDIRLVGEDVARDFWGEAQGVEGGDAAAEFDDGA